MYVTYSYRQITSEETEHLLQHIIVLQTKMVSRHPENYAADSTHTKKSNDACYVGKHYPEVTKNFPPLYPFHKQAEQLSYKNYPPQEQVYLLPHEGIGRRKNSKVSSGAHDAELLPPYNNPHQGQMDQFTLQGTQ